jgi:release factor glutamine methyltransferase
MTQAAAPRTSDPDTIRAIVARARERLAGSGIHVDEAALDARLLAQRVLAWDAARYLSDSHLPPPASFSARYQQLVDRRAAREPVAYITGSQEFWGLDFEVTPAVLVPRPETELLIEVGLARCPAHHAAAIADVGTGSGCLAIALARERPGARLVATDVSADALAVARGNAVRHRVDRRIEFVRTDLLADVPGTFDLIVSNPPYVPELGRETLPPEVLHEPAIALFGGIDGLAGIRRLVDRTPEHLAGGGILAFEFGFGQDERVTRLIAESGTLTLLDLRRDLQGIPRVAVSSRR